MDTQANLGLIALARFGFGPRGDGDAAVAATDPRGFLEAELSQPGIALLSGPMLPPTASALQQFYRDQELRKTERAQALAARTEAVSPAKAAMTSGFVIGAPARPDQDKTMTAAAAAAAAPTAADAKPPVRPPTPEQIIFRAESLARFRRAIEARAGIVERLVAFWSNHFCVSAGKGPIGRVTAGAFEREVIRPHVLGRFSDMLLAAESHPAMLHFLDNARSVGPNSPAGQRGKAGLNENLGREIMELHTLGVGSGYTQADVAALAAIITGWTFVGPKGAIGEPGTFAFNAKMHEPGPITLLGKVYPEGGMAQGQDALLDIAARPETARFIAAKLVRAFVADVPPKPLVDRLANVFHATRGDLRALTLALLDAPESWERTPRRMRDPYEIIIATNRLLGHLPEEPGQVLGPLAALGMPLWTPPGPNGFPTTTAAWASPEGMKLRLDYSAEVAARLKDPPNPSDLLETMCGGSPSQETRVAIARADSRQQGLALLLMSPEMQRS